ncbi:hypothetical protein GCM10010335_09890 [Streptomyces galbus]|nr:hypothetical protein GCM10010335_09890 [Streptomyces galbus]
MARETPARRATSALVGTGRDAGDDGGAGGSGICTMTYRILAEARRAPPPGGRQPPSAGQELEPVTGQPAVSGAVAVTRSTRSLQPASSRSSGIPH